MAADEKNHATGGGAQQIIEDDDVEKWTRMLYELLHSSLSSEGSLAASDVKKLLKGCHFTQNEWKKIDIYSEWHRELVIGKSVSSRHDKISVVLLQTLSKYEEGEYIDSDIFEDIFASLILRIFQKVKRLNRSSVDVHDTVQLLTMMFIGEYEEASFRENGSGLDLDNNPKVSEGTFINYFAKRAAESICAPAAAHTKRYLAAKYLRFMGACLGDDTLLIKVRESKISVLRKWNSTPRRPKSDSELKMLQARRESALLDDESEIWALARELNSWNPKCNPHIMRVFRALQGVDPDGIVDSGIQMTRTQLERIMILPPVKVMCPTYWTNLIFDMEITNGNEDISVERLRAVIERVFREVYESLSNGCRISPLDLPAYLQIARVMTLNSELRADAFRSSLRAAQEEMPEIFGDFRPERFIFSSDKFPLKKFLMSMVLLWVSEIKHGEFRHGRRALYTCGLLLNSPCIHAKMVRTRARAARHRHNRRSTISHSSTSQNFLSSSSGGSGGGGGAEQDLDQLAEWVAAANEVGGLHDFGGGTSAIGGGGNVGGALKATPYPELNMVQLSKQVRQMGTGKPRRISMPRLSAALQNAGMSHAQSQIHIGDFLSLASAASDGTVRCQKFLDVTLHLQLVNALTVVQNYEFFIRQKTEKEGWLTQKELASILKKSVRGRLARKQCERFASDVIPGRQRANLRDIKLWHNSYMRSLREAKQLHRELRDDFHYDVPKAFNPNPGIKYSNAPLQIPENNNYHLTTKVFSSSALSPGKKRSSKRGKYRATRSAHNNFDTGRSNSTNDKSSSTCKSVQIRRTGKQISNTLGEDFKEGGKIQKQEQREASSKMEAKEDEERKSAGAARRRRTRGTKIRGGAGMHALLQNTKKIVHMSNKRLTQAEKTFRRRVAKVKLRDAKGPDPVRHVALAGAAFGLDARDAIGHW